MRKHCNTGAPRAPIQFPKSPRAIEYERDRFYDDDHLERQRRIALYAERHRANVVADANRRNQQGLSAEQVRLVGTTQVYRCAAAAAKAFGVSPGTIRASCRGHRPVSRIGLTFEWFGEALPVLNGRCRSIQCVETGREWPSMSQASRDLSIPVQSLHDAVSKGKAYRGLHYRYASTSNGEVRDAA